MTCTNPDYISLFERQRTSESMSNINTIIDFYVSLMILHECTLNVKKIILKLRHPPGTYMYRQSCSVELADSVLCLPGGQEILSKKYYRG